MPNDYLNHTILIWPKSLRIQRQKTIKSTKTHIILTDRAQFRRKSMVSQNKALYMYWRSSTDDLIKYNQPDIPGVQNEVIQVRWSLGSLSPELVYLFYKCFLRNFEFVKSDLFLLMDIVFVSTIIPIISTNFTVIRSLNFHGFAVFFLVMNFISFILRHEWFACYFRCVFSMAIFFMLCG